MFSSVCRASSDDRSRDHGLAIDATREILADLTHPDGLVDRQRRIEPHRQQLTNLLDRALLQHR